MSEEPDFNVDDEVIGHKSSKPDELTKYLDMFIDKTTLSSNSLAFLRDNQNIFIFSYVSIFDYGFFSDYSVFCAISVFFSKFEKVVLYGKR